MAYEQHPLGQYRDWYDEWATAHHRISMPHTTEQIVDFYIECERLIMSEWLSTQNESKQSTTQKPSNRSQSCEGV